MSETAIELSPSELPDERSSVDSLLEEVGSLVERGANAEAAHKIDEVAGRLGAQNLAGLIEDGSTEWLQRESALAFAQITDNRAAERSLQPPDRFSPN